MEEVVSIIQTLGFPIACCVALFYRMGKEEERHQEEMNSLKQSLDENTKVLTRLYERLSGGPMDG